VAPERPPYLAIFDARFDRGALKGTVHYVEQTEFRQLRVRWSVDSKPEGFIEVGGGVAYVYDEKGVKQVPISTDARPDYPDENRYVWHEGLEERVPWLMYILILPERSTLRNPNPMPRGVKIFDGEQDEQGPRLALFWFLEPGDFGRATLECEITELEGDLESELRWINRNYIHSTDSAPPNPEVAVEDPPRKGESETSVDRSVTEPTPQSVQGAVLQWVWTTPRWLQILIVLVALLVIMIFAVWTSLPEDTKGQLIDSLFSS
jgi:hypothetical protein